MSVDNDVHNGAIRRHHTRAPITVADGFGAKPAAAPSNPGPARPTPGNVNAPVKPLPDIKADPKRDPSRASSPDIDRGIRDMRDKHKALEGQTQLQNGIDDVVGRSVGGNNLGDYFKVKRATDEILKTYGRRKDLTEKDKAAVINAVNEYLRRKVVDGFVQAKNDAQLDWAKKVAVSYLTDPNPMSREHRLVYLTGQMLMARVDRKVVDDVIAQYEASKKK